MKKTDFPKRGDIIILTVSILICVALFIIKSLSSGNPIAVIYKDGKEINRIDLNKVTSSYEIDLECLPSAKLKVEKGSIRYCEADCHDKLCMKFGELKDPGDTAACLPSKTLIIIEGEKPSDAPDTITY